MSPAYGARSRRVLATLHQDLRLIFQAVLDAGFDHSLLEGYRDEETQNRYFREGISKARFPHSKHNVSPSMAVDAMPWFRQTPNIDWTHQPSFYHFAGVVRGVALEKFRAGDIKHLIRWGGDWNNNFDVREKEWVDAAHFELYLPA